MYYVKADYVPDFATEVAPFIRHPFLLLTTMSSYTVPRNANDTWMLQNNKFLVKWFAKNPRYSHPKLEAIPIGLVDKSVFKFTIREEFDQLLR